ncbi:hypothetical protein SAMN05421759_11064 [Roseivivax lentus]|uniref:Contractile injection system tube protein N-terminal domain-containing protein n=1 Tax=Roseivivax lentus TaxID=633194 RepID=A0A1N7NUD2_9RHOB|nr:hypothetical protein [Roseivivax lentus]SIT01898.1 hypothetical protein SAMN05421759_11064 [Roseivivax lentus]
MTGYSRSPRLLKAAIVAFRLPVPIPAVIPFQINPDTMSRTVEANLAESEGGTETFRLAGAPKETYKIETVLDATDDLERDDATARTIGLHARLAQFETLIYPLSATVIANSVMMAAGRVEVLPPKALFTVFVWGRSRILPVRISSLNITEEAFDPNLNPIRAKVAMDLAVLSTSDLQISHPGYAMFLSHQIVKETMAAVGQVNSLGRVLGSDIAIL